MPPSFTGAAIAAVNPLAGKSRVASGDAIPLTASARTTPRSRIARPPSPAATGWWRRSVSSSPVRADRGDQHGVGGIVGIGQSKHADFVAEQLAGTFGGSLQHLVDGQPVDDPPL